MLLQLKQKVIIMASVRKIERTIVSARFSVELVDTLRVLAEDQHRSLSNLMEKVLIEYAEKESKAEEVEH